jgi:GGDEF domain-containing protein
MLKFVLPAADPIAAAPRPSLNEVVDSILHVVAQLLDTRLTAVARIETPTYTTMAVVDQLHQIRPGQLFNLRDTFCLHMLERGAPLRITDTSQAGMPFRTLPHALEVNIRAYAGVPLAMPDGRIFGSLWAADDKPRAWSDEDIALLQLIARLLTHELDQDAHARHRERVEQSAAIHSSIDPGTGLLARDGFESLLRRESLRRGRYGNVHAVAILALDHAAPAQADPSRADMLRQELADILMRTSRIVDCCARIDEDDFAVLFVETASTGVAAWRARVEAAIAIWNRIHAASGLALCVAIGVADCHDVAHEPDQAAAMLDVARDRAREHISSPN